MPARATFWKKRQTKNVRVHFADADRLNAISKGARHQGVVGFIDASKNHVHLEDVLENLSEPPLLLILDGITTRTTSARACVPPTQWAYTPSSRRKTKARG